MKSLIAAVALFSLLLPSAASAQAAGPYVTGHLGVSGGDTGASLAGGGAVGYMSPERIAFELEVGVTPGLEFGDSLPRILQSSALPSIFPGPSIEARGRVLTFQSNVVATLTGGGPWRISVSGGGGVANRHEDVVVRYADIVFPDVFPIGLTTSGALPFDFQPREVRTSRSDSALCLNAGAIVEHTLGAALALGADLRYTHAFFSGSGWDAGRVAARLRWQF